MGALTHYPRRSRRIGAVELAIAFALGGSALAVAVPAFVRNVHASRMAEPVEGLQRIASGAIQYAQNRPASQAFPPSVATTPEVPPRGHCDVDPEELWQRPTWVALQFRPVPPGRPHCFSFGFDSALSPAKATFRAHAHGDLDGDGMTSTFEVTGQSTDGDGRGPVIDPGMFVESEVE
jgi:hypothetical protein